MSRPRLRAIRGVAFTVGAEFYAILSIAHRCGVNYRWARPRGAVNFHRAENGPNGAWERVLDLSSVYGFRPVLLGC